MKKLGFKELVTIGLGMIIGSGVITLTGFGIGYTGTGVFLAYIGAGIAFLFCMLPTFIVGITIPRTSFSYTVCKELMSPFMGGIFLMIFFVGRIIMSFFGVAFASYVASIIPGINQKLVALGIITLFYILNLFGVQTATKIQRFLNILLILALGSFAILGIMKLQPDALTAGRLFPNGFKGFFSAVVLLMFPMGGGLTLLEFGDNIENPKKNLTSAVIVVSAVAIVLFALVGLAGGGVLPQTEVANKPLTFAARTIYGSAIGVNFFVIGGALMAIVTTINSSFMWYCNTMIKGITDGWLPQVLATKNKFDVPYIILTVFYLIGIIPILMGANIGFLGTVATGLALLFFLIPNFSLIGLPKKYPEEWKQFRFHTDNQLLVTLFTLVCSGSFVALIVSNFLSYKLPVLLSILGVFACGTLYVAIRYNQLKKRNANG